MFGPFKKKQKPSSQVAIPSKPNKPEEPKIDYEATFRGKFRPIEREMNSIRTKAKMKRNSFVFDRHTFSVEQVMAFPHWEKIRSFEEKIRADVLDWIQSKQFPPEGQRAYDGVVQNFNDALSALENEIAERPSTFIERLFETVRAVTTPLRKILPFFRYIVGRAGELALGLPMGSLSHRRSDRALPAPKNNHHTDLEQ